MATLDELQAEFNAQIDALQAANDALNIEFQAAQARIEELEALPTEAPATLELLEVGDRFGVIGHFKLDQEAEAIAEAEAYAAEHPTERVTVQPRQLDLLKLSEVWLLATGALIQFNPLSDVGDPLLVIDPTQTETPTP